MAEPPSDNVPGGSHFLILSLIDSLCNTRPTCRSSHFSVQTDQCSYINSRETHAYSVGIKIVNQAEVVFFECILYVSDYT